MSSRSSSKRKQSDKKAAKHASSDDGSDDEDKLEIVSENESSDGSLKFKPSRRSQEPKPHFSMPEDIKKLMERVLCCSCGKQLNPMNEGSIRKHPWLKVITCKKCYRFLRSGPFTRDDEGTDEQCRWCGDGGRLYGCDYCNHCFCRSCIKRNLGRTEAAEMEEDNGSKWHCYMCKPKKVKHLQADCKKILDYIQKEDEKEAARLERAKQREKDKMEAYKKEKMKLKKEREEKDDKKDSSSKPDKSATSKPETKSEKESSPKRGLPAPKSKEKVTLSVKKEGHAPHTSHKSVKNSDPDLIIIDSPDKKTIKEHIPHFQHHRATHYKPDKDTGVQKVVKSAGNVLQVTVGPKKPAPVVMPYKQGLANTATTGLIGQPGVSLVRNMPKTAHLPGSFDVAGFKIVAERNDIHSLKKKIYPFNVDQLVQKLLMTTQSFNLSLNSVKTDLAIAKLTSVNQTQQQSVAAEQLKSAMDVMLNSVREHFNVQLVAVPPEENKDSKTSIKSESSDSKMGQSTDSKNSGKSDVAVIMDKEGNLVILSDEEKSEEKSEKTKQVNGDVEDDYVVEVNDDFNTDASAGEEEDKANDEDCELMEVDQDESVTAESETSPNKDNIEKHSSDNDDKSNKDTIEKDSDDNSVLEDDKVERDTSELSENTTAQMELLKEVSNETDDESEGAEEGSEAVESEEEGTKVTRRSTRTNNSGDKEKKKGSSKNSSKENAKKDKQAKGSAANSDEVSEEEEVKKSRSHRRSSRKSSKDEDEDKGIKTKKATEKKSGDRNSKSAETNKESDEDKREENNGSEDNEATSKRSHRSAVKKSDKESDDKADKSKSSAEKEKKNSSKKQTVKNEDSEDQVSDTEGSEKDKATKKDKSSEKSKSKDSSEKSVPKTSKATEKEHSSDTEENVPAHSSDTEEHSPSELPDIVKNGNVSSMDESDNTDCSLDSLPEFNKRKKKRKSSSRKKEEETESPTRSTRSRKAKSESTSKKSKSGDKTKSEAAKLDNSDQDSDFDSDLESEIKKLSKDTKLTRTRTRAAKDEGTKGGKSTDKESQKKKRSAKSKPDDEAENGDDDNDDAADQDNEDEEKEVSGSATDVEEEAVTRSVRQKGKSKAEEAAKGKKSEEKGKKGKKSAIIYDSDSNDDDDAPPPEEDDEDDDDENRDNSDTLEELTASQIKKMKKGQEAEEEDSDAPAEMFSDLSSDPDISFPKLSTSKKGKGGKKDDETMSEDSDFLTPQKKKKKLKSKLLDANVTESDSEEDTKKKKKGKGKGKGKRNRSDVSGSDGSDNGKKKKGKRKRIKRMSSSDEEKEPGAEDAVGSDEMEDEDGDTPGGYLKRRKIRRVQGTKKLKEETKAAQKAEEERRKRIDDRQKEYNAYVEVEGAEEEEDVPEGTERENVDVPVSDSISKILGSPKKVPVTTKCVLEMDKETKKTIIEVDRTLVRKLKPHQVEAVRFMFNCCVESVECIKKGDEGAGCIVAHCMGLGKTLSVISYVHTMLRNVKHTKMEKCLVVCPLNTCLNWVNEFEIWLDDVDFEIEVYEMSRVKQNFERAQMLKEWHEGGAAVLILGYDMYRNLVLGSHCKNKKQKKIFYECLADPGPDLVVCDEGHILKNDQTSLSKAMQKIKSQRRVVLTGTPLQNNLTEYHCMVSFVKPRLLGTRKEFGNRFANPITNGQCKDSTSFDVKLMKRRAHILHELLAGCVQRKDYSALTKFLPPKFEYVISVRLSPVQIKLYEKYLELSGQNAEDIHSKGARLFKDYQALMRIWTHPWVLKLDEIRQENKRTYDDEDSFVDDSSEESISDKTSSDSPSDSDSDAATKKRKTRGNKGGTSSDDNGKKNEDKDEVVKKWTSRRRGNEEGAGSSWMEEMGYSTGPKELTSEWWAEFVKEEDENKLELSGKLMLLFEILKMCEDIGDKVLLFSQSLLSLDIIEDFLQKIDEANSDKGAEGTSTTNGEGSKDKAGGSGSGAGASSKEGAETEVEKKKKEDRDKLAQYGKSWTKGADYFRMDGSTSSIHRKAAQDYFNDAENFRARLFLISTKAGCLGINLVGANRVIIFDASWNPSHDIQSIFRVYRFGQVKPVYVYRFLAQGTMEEKIYERQVTKQSLSQRVVDEHQIERHFDSADLQELYKFTPERLDDPERKERPLPVLPKDHMLAEMTTTNKDWIVTFHEHDSLLENKTEQELSEEEKKAAWEDYENEKKGLMNNVQRFGTAYMNPAIAATQQMNMQNLLLQGQNTLGQAAVLQIIQDLKARFPNTPPEIFQQRVQAVLRQVLTQQIMQQSEMQRRQIEQQKLTELNRLNQLKQQIQRQQAMLNGQPQMFNMAGNSAAATGFSGLSNVNNGAAVRGLLSNHLTTQQGQRGPTGMPLLRQAMQHPNIMRKK